MKPSRPLFLVPLFVACASPTHTTDLDGFCFRRFELFESNAVTGQAIKVPIKVTYGCNSGTAPPSKSATVVLTRPDGETVEPSSVTPEGGGEIPSAPQRTQSVRVGFTPDRPGTWNIAVTFDPAGSFSQDVEAVEARYTAPSKVIAWTGPSQCNQFAIDSHDTLLCLRSGNFRDRELFTSRGEVQYGRAFAVDGDALWRVSESELERQLDDGSAFTVTHRLARTGLSGPMVVQNGDVVLRDGYTLLRAHAEADGGLSLTSTQIGREPDAIVATASGVAFWSTKSGSPCVTLVPGGCPPFDNDGLSSTQLAGADPDALYVQHQFACVEGDGPNCFELVAVNGTTEARVPLPAEASALDWPDFALGPFAPVVPMSRDSIDRRVAVPRRDGDKLSLELFEPGFGFRPVSSATRTHAFAHADDGRSVKVFER